MWSTVGTVPLWRNNKQTPLPLRILKVIFTSCYWGKELLEKNILVLESPWFFPKKFCIDVVTIGQIKIEIISSGILWCTVGRVHSHKLTYPSCSKWLLVIHAWYNVPGTWVQGWQILVFGKKSPGLCGMFHPLLWLKEDDDNVRHPNHSFSNSLYQSLVLHHTVVPTVWVGWINKLF